MIYISSVPFYETAALGDQEFREILDGVIDVASEEANMLTMLEYLDAIKPTENKTFYNYTNTFLYERVTVNDATPPTVTTSGVTVTLDDNTHLRAGSVLLTANGTVLFCTAVDGGGADVTLKTLSGTYATSDNEILTVPTNAVGEGSSNGEMEERGLTKRSNQIQTFENGIKVTDLLAAGKTVINHADGNQYYFYKLQNDAFLKHKVDIANNHLIGKFGSSTDASGNTVLFSRGLDNSIVDLGGVSQQTASVGTLTKADFATFCRALDLARSPKEGLMPVGGAMNILIDNLFDTELAAGMVDRGVFGEGSNAAKAVDLGINKFKVYGRSFEKFVLAQLDHTNVTAATGFIYPDLAYYIPKGPVRVENGAMEQRIVGRYLKFADAVDVNGRFHEKLLGGFAPVPTHKDNYLEIRYTSYEGLEVNGTEHFGRLKVQR